MSPRLLRAELLYHQGRYDLAEAEARLALADAPDDPAGHVVLARCLTELGKHADATAEAERAVALGPDRPAGHAALAAARLARNHLPEAAAAAREAVRLDPADANHHALLAAVAAARDDWPAALAAADRGLAQDPEHGWSANLRAMALVRLGRRDEARVATEGALARDPDDAFTHANRGWELLHDGDPRRALEHFREALRLDPELDYARYGMIEALKARYRLYRWVLGYFLWLARLGPRARWGVVLGLLAVQRVTASVARSNPDLRPVLEPVLIAYAAFALTTWTAGPLSNLFLRLNRFGRHALSADERTASHWVGGCVALALAAAGWGVVNPFGYGFLGWPPAVGFALLVVPVAGVYGCEPGWPRRVMGAAAVGMAGLVFAVAGLLAAGVAHDGAPDGSAVWYARRGFELFGWVPWAGLGASLLGNYLAGVRPRR